MSDPKRYSIVADYQAPWAKMHEFSAGGWVKWEDYARLKAEVERLTVAADWKTPARKIQALEAEVERLRKAGDYMADHLAHEFGTCPSIEVWNAAKEGKPQ